jgi:predicted Zn-dependent peptidase
VTVLKRSFGAAAQLLADALRRPRLQASDWERVKRLHLEGLRQQDDEPEAVASRIGMQVLFGKDSPYGWSIGGTVDSVEALTLDLVKREQAQLFDPGSAVILVAGDLTAAEAKATLDQTFGDWPRTAAPGRPAPDLGAAPGKQLRVVLVDRPDAVQTVIRFVAPGPRYADPRRMHCQLLNTLLGGGFTSRLNQNLRERHGYTYGAGSGYLMSPFAGWFTASASVQAKVTGAALQEFLAEFARLAGNRGDVSDDEAVKARETLRTATIDSFAGLRGILSTASELALNHMPFDTVGKDLAAIAAADAASLNAMCQAALPIDQGVLVLVGDKRVILEQLQGLPLPAPLELDVHGAPVAH